MYRRGHEQPADREVVERMDELITARPDTTMGRALAARALGLAARARPVADVPRDAVDMTTPEQVMPPEHVREAAKAALDRGETHYTVRPGVPELRAAIAHRSTGDGYPATVEGTVITNGGAEALYIALQSTLRPGDVLLAGAPLAPQIVAMAEFIGARVAPLPLYGTRFQPRPEDVAAADGAVLLLASPSAVTGYAVPPADLVALTAAAIERGLTVIIDRSLAWCCYDPADAQFPDPQLGARVLTTGSFSAAYAMDGWRVGYFTAPAEHLTTMRELKQAMSICTSAVSQFAALASLDGPDDWLVARRAEMRARRDAMARAFAARGVAMPVPDAWPPLMLDLRSIDADDEAAARRLAADEGIIVEPTSRYADALAGYARIDLRVPRLAFDACLARLQGRPRA